MEQNMDYRLAREYLLEKIAPMDRLEQVPLAQAVGRVLAEPVYATGDVPPFDRSPFDGYAFQAADTQNAEQQPVTLRILEEVPAGSMWKQTVTPGTATKILTGAPVPPGADAVTKYEDTIFNAETVTISKTFQSGDNVVPRGEDVQKGQQLATAGTIIDSALLGTLAAQGITAPLVYAVPKVGIITTGSELVEPGTPLTGGKIVNTNQYTFRAAVAQAGCEPIFLGTPGDDPEAIAAAIAQGLPQCDLLISTGGVSVGDYDFTPDAMERAGAALHIRTLKLKPGGASAYGFAGKTLLCGLSGNPASALTNFYAVVLPVLRRLRGLSTPHLTEIPVILGEDFNKKSPKTRLIRGILDLTTGENVMHVSRAQGNGVLHSLIGCDLLAEIPAGSPRLSAGTKLTAYLIP
jgi:molybdopterin molybdotransferase